MALVDIYNKLLDRQATVLGKSLYATNRAGTTVVRVANHLPDAMNIRSYNADQETVILIFCGDHKESDVIRAAGKLETETGKRILFAVVEDENDGVGMALARQHIRLYYDDPPVRVFDNSDDNDDWEEMEIAAIDHEIMADYGWPVM